MRGVLGQQRQHVVEEADAGRDLRRGRAVEIDLQADIGFGRLAFDCAVRGIIRLLFETTKYTKHTKV